MTLLWELVSEGPTPVVGGVAYHVYGGGSRKVGDHMLVGKAKLAYLDVETTGLSPAMGDRIVEIGIVACRGRQEVERLSWLLNPDRPIPADAHQVHGISDGDVADCPEFRSLAQDVCVVLHDTWIVGHNVWFDAGFGSLLDDLAKVRRD